MVSKDYVAKLGKIKHVFREKDLLNEMDHPFIIKLKDTRMVRSSKSIIVVYRTLLICTLFLSTAAMETSPI